MRPSHLAEFSITLLLVCLLLVILFSLLTPYRINDSFLALIHDLLFAGMNSILLYVGHETFGAFIPFSWGIDDHATHAEWLAMNLLAVSYWVLIAYYCYKIKFFLKI